MNRIPIWHGESKQDADGDKSREVLEKRVNSLELRSRT